MKLYLSVLVVVVMATVAACDSSHDTIDEVVRKLEDFATGVKVFTSGVTKASLLRAVDAWKELPKDDEAEALTMPQYKLFYHFGIIPTERIRDELNSLLISSAHIARLEQAYKRFRPSYSGKLIEDRQSGNLKIRKAIEVLTKLRNHKPCTIKDFKLADEELSAWLARFKDIVTHEDVYSLQEEIKNILNYLNADLLTPMFEHVFPLLGKIDDPDKLQEIYHEKLFEAIGVRFDENGKAVRS